MEFSILTLTQMTEMQLKARLSRPRPWFRAIALVDLHGTIVHCCTVLRLPGWRSRLRDQTEAAVRHLWLLEHLE